MTDLFHSFLYQSASLLLEASVLLGQTPSAVEHNFTIFKYCRQHYSFKSSLALSTAGSQTTLSLQQTIQTTELVFLFPFRKSSPQASVSFPQPCLIEKTSWRQSKLSTKVLYDLPINLNLIRTSNKHTNKRT